MLTSKKHIQILQRLFIFGIIMVMGCCSANAKKPLITTTKPEALKTVNRICIGFIDGRQNNVVEFKANLEKELVLAGFLLSPPCDATLVASVEAMESQVLFQKTIPTYVDVTLLTPSNEVIWAKHFSPRSGLLNFKRQYFSKPNQRFTSNGLVNRPMTIADTLKRDKAKLLKAQP